ncbi:thiamine pyrophosphokinase [Helicobacter pylori Hp H-45]|uniref:Thiamine pyrophosphokinase n=1 Tax=Helicobacter pylori Hp H-45 TaxID=992050 RepID=I9T9W1_HELPX|nr:thiamine pyrophosphokinase [Helicobacter pylori Hp H-45]
MLETPFTLPSFKGEQISLFSLDFKAQFTSKNLKYPLKNLRLKTLFSGSLNEATDSFLALTLNLNRWCWCIKNFYERVC